MKRNAAVVLGGYVNGYNIIKALARIKDIQFDIVLLDCRKNIAAYSNRVDRILLFDKSIKQFKDRIKQLKQFYDYLIFYPTADFYLEYLTSIYYEINSFSFIPLNPANTMENLNKWNQYRICEKIGIPRPETIRISEINDIGNIKKLKYPVIVKPVRRYDGLNVTFRSLILNSDTVLGSKESIFKESINKGSSFMASEIVPGDADNICAYTAYRSPMRREILAYWTGKKLSQHPDDYGVFSSASNQAPEIIKEQGEKIVEAMDAFGIIEPEFKYDCRDGKHKLMEVNLRSMMWHAVGLYSGVNLPEIQLRDALGMEVTESIQSKKLFHFIYINHEIINLIQRKGYLANFRRNFVAKKKYYAVYDSKDLQPFVLVFYRLLKSLIKICLKRLFVNKPEKHYPML